MQFVSTTGAAALLLLFGTTVPAYAQHDQQNERRGKPDKQKDKQQRQERPQARQQQRGTSEERRGQVAQPQQQQRSQQTQGQRPEQQQIQRQAQQQRTRQNQQQSAQPRQEQRPQQARQQPQRPYRTAGGFVATEAGMGTAGRLAGHSTWQQSRARQWESEHRTWAQRGGYGGYYIPQDRFRSRFGNQHWFRMRTGPRCTWGIRASRMAASRS